MHRDCDPVRDLAFDYRSGSLSDVEARRVDDHLDSCQPCADYFARVATLLDAPNRVAEEAAASIDADALFAKITQQISIPASGDTLIFGESSEGAHPFADSSVDNTLKFSALDNAEEYDAPEETATDWADDTPANLNLDWNSGGRAGWFVAAIAAIFAAALAFGLIRETQSNRGEQNPPTLADGGRIELPSLSAPSPAIELRGTPEARWSLDESGTGQRVLTVSAGAVLVEYVPVDERGLRVHAPGAEFDVVGTVFYVDARDGNTEIGVLTGAVEVGPHRVEGGHVHEHGAVRPFASSEEDEWTGHVDVAMHEVRLEASATRLEPIALHVPELEAPEVVPEPEVEVAAVTPQPEREPRPEHSRPVERVERAEDPVEVEPTPEPVDLRDAAESAMAERRWQDAATAYESLIRSGGSSSGTRLDLARLYLRQLDMPDRALPHLRRFVRDNPRDPVTESALNELCRISELRGMREPLCIP